MSVIVGAYAASPTNAGWDPRIDEELYAGIAEIPGVRGLELPWTGSLHPHDDEWLISNLRQGWDLVYTTIQATARKAIDDPRFGIASDDEDGRREAVAVLEGAFRGISNLGERLGQRSVRALEIHTQPRRLAGGQASSASLSRSLEEILGWDWQGTEILVEHSDAAIEGTLTPKGYLSLDEEIEAVSGFSGAPLGLEINWGRSAIEFRDGDRVIEHIIRARESGLLASLFFSGVSDQDGAFGAAWDDSHPPFAPAEGYETFEPTSILTRERVTAAIEAAGDVRYLGIKIGHRPFASPVGRPLALLREAVTYVNDIAG